MAKHGNNTETRQSEVDSTTDRSQRRRIMKHMVEKRRRNRINNCLEQMRVLVLKLQNKNPDNYTKMEKADIMEMTTNFMYMLNNQQTTTGKAVHNLSLIQNSPPSVAPSTTDIKSTMLQDYSSGYKTCQNEINNYLNKVGIHRPVPVSPYMSPVAPLSIETAPHGNILPKMNVTSSKSMNSEDSTNKHMISNMTQDSLLMVCNNYNNNLHNNTTIRHEIVNNMSKNVNRSTDNTSIAWRPW